MPATSMIHQLRQTGSRAPNRLRVSLLMTLFALGLGVCATAQAAGDGSEVIAKVGEREITRGEVNAAASADLDAIEVQRAQSNATADFQAHQVFEGTARGLVDKIVVEQEAAARGITPAELMTVEVAPKVVAVTDADIDSFYEQNKSGLGGQAKEPLVPRIRDFLTQQRQAQAYEQFVDGLKSKYDVSVDIEPYRVKVEAGDSPSRGPAAAPVTIVAFSDFECPACRAAVPALDQLAKSYSDKVRVVFRQFPLRNIHPKAQKAAEASLCAADQGKFWQLHDLMFAEQKTLAVTDLKAKAELLELDTETFGQCLDSAKYAARVDEDLRAGALAGVARTPSLLINGRLIEGAPSFDDLKKLVDEELTRSSR